MRIDLNQYNNIDFSKINDDHIVIIICTVLGIVLGALSAIAYIQYTS